MLFFAYSFINIMSSLEVWLIIGAVILFLLVSGFLIRRFRVYQWGRVKSKYTLKGKIFVITGANTGLGFETAKALAKREATVILACRSAEKAENAIKKIRDVTQSGELIFVPLDLASFESIRSSASILSQQFPIINCLILNAGIATFTEEYTSDGFEIQFGVNHLGHFLLFQRLRENLQENNARIVVVSSVTHTRGEIDFDNLGKYVKPRQIGAHYQNSKLANFYFARELFKRNFDVHVLCPGPCFTDVFRYINLHWYSYILIFLVSPIFLFVLKTAQQGAENIVHCALDARNTETVNPATGFIVMNLKPSKSPVKFSEEISTQLWDESLLLVAG